MLRTYSYAALALAAVGIPACSLLLSPDGLTPVRSIVDAGGGDSTDPGVDVAEAYRDSEASGETRDASDDAESAVVDSVVDADRCAAMDCCGGACVDGKCQADEIKGPLRDSVGLKPWLRMQSINGVLRLLHATNQGVFGWSVDTNDLEISRAPALEPGQRVVGVGSSAFDVFLGTTLGLYRGQWGDAGSTVTRVAGDGFICPLLEVDVPRDSAYFACTNGSSVQLVRRNSSAIFESCANASIESMAIEGDRLYALTKGGEGSFAYFELTAGCNGNASFTALRRATAPRGLSINGTHLAYGDADEKVVVVYDTADPRKGAVAIGTSEVATTAVTDGNVVYWASESGAIYMQEAKGSSSEAPVSVAHSDGVHAMALHNRCLFWANTTTGSLFRVGVP